MRKPTVFAIFIFLFIIIGTEAIAQLSGNYTVGTGGNYPSLTRNGGFFAAVNSQGLSGNVTVSIISDVTNENGNNALNQWTETGVGGYTITIRPSAATERLVSGTNTNGLFRLNGADRVTFDGRFSGIGEYLRFRNTNTTNPTFIFLNDATNNTITYCNIEGSNTNTTAIATIGTILFSTTTETQGNDNNIISYCDISDRSDVTGYPAYAIYSYGTFTTTARYNSGNQILNNNIFNFWKEGDYCGAIYLTLGTGDNWQISGNSLYQTSPRNTNGNSDGGWNVIFLNFTGINNCSVTNNYIGGSAPNCGGSPWTASTNAGALQLPGIRAFVGTATQSSIQGNTIANIDFTTRATSSGALPFVGILIQAGDVDVGSTSGNTIGSSTGNDNISITYSNLGNVTQTSRGIDHRASGNIENNVVGSITISSSITNTSTFEGISYVSSPISSVSISNNTVGSNTTTNSIQHSTSNRPVTFRGLVSTLTGVGVTINNNIVANISCNSSDNETVNYAILNTGNGTAAITNNTIHDISSPLTNTTYIGILGIGNTSTASSQLIQGNTIYSLNSTTSGSFNTGVVALDVEGSTGSGTIARNRVYGLTNTSIGTAPFIFGLNAYWGSWTASNNQIAITNGEATDNINQSKVQPTSGRTKLNSNTIYKTKQIRNEDKIAQTTSLQIPLENESLETVDNKKNFVQEKDLSTNRVIIQGIHNESDGVWNYYYNSVYIGGSATTGNANSYCYARQNYGPSTVTFRNNLFFNARTGGTGYHYAIANEYGGSSGWTATASNYNVFVSSDSTTIGEWNIGTNTTIDQWRTSSSGDNQSWSVTSAQISASNLFSSIVNGNLNIRSGNQEAWLVSGKGIALSGQNTDFEGTSRVTTISGGTTDIGSDEFAATPPNSPQATVDIAPGSGVTSNFSLYGRRIVTINWGTGGTSYPSAMNVRYYSGVVPPAVLGGNFSDSYWLINVGSGSFSGTTYDVTIYFGDNETYTITSPSSNTRLAKSNGTWEVFPLGSGNLQTQLNWANLTVRTNGLPGFSNFALTDATAPLPVLLSYFGAAVNQRNVNLKWITESEINNKGFDLERRGIVKQGQYSEWKSIAFIEGYGNSNQQITYTYNDTKLSSGNYQYRLKQIDYNGNYEYFNLENPSEVVIGVPNSVDVSQNYPNPSNPISLIDYQLSFTGKVALKVYDISGREVLTLVDEVKEPGYYTAKFNGSALASGIYIYRLIINGDNERFSKSFKLVLVK
jgi:Secretion system C-terminal sorting domain